MNQTTKIFIENEWIDYNSENIVKTPYRGNFRTSYNNVFLSSYIDIKFLCEKCNKEHTIKWFRFTDTICDQCKIKSSRLEKYGVENFFQLKSVHEKAIKNSTTAEAREKYEQTNIKIYGRAYNLSDQIYKEEAMMKAHGVKYPGQMDSTKQALREKYWDKLKNEEYNKKVVDRRRKTNEETYGNSFPNRFGSLNFKKAMKRIYGVEHAMHVPFIYNKAFLTCKKSWGIKIYKTIFNDMIHYQSGNELEFIQNCENKNVKVLDGPTIPYNLNQKECYYHIDFETEKYLIEIKGSNKFYYETLESGEIDAKNKAAQIYAASINKEFLFLLNDTGYPHN